jgi:mono/diheme cytochrome c family protein
MGLATLLVGGCRQGMYDQAKYLPYRGSPLFADGRASRPLVEDTIPVGGLDRDDAKLAWKVNNKFVEQFPMPVTPALIKRGQERFNIYCVVCHGPAGFGDGMIVQRGFPPPPSYHIDRLRTAAPGYFVDVMTNGFGVMYPYADRVTLADRWAIAAYIRALQRSEDGKLADVPAAERAKLEANR